MELTPNRSLLDKENRKPIAMTDEQGRTLHFRQIYVTEREGAIYLILRPVEPVLGLGETAAVAFRLGEDGQFYPVRDRACSEEIFEEYYAALRDERRTQ